MRNSFFAISMGFIDLNTPNLLKTQKTDIYSFIMRKLAKLYLDLGAKIYLQYPVEYIESEKEVIEIIVQRGYCIMSFESGISISELSDKAMSIVKNFGCVLVTKAFAGERNEIGYQEYFEECFEPYWVSKFTDKECQLDEILDDVMYQLSTRIQYGRGLKLESKPLIERVLSRCETSSLLA